MKTMELFTNVLGYEDIYEVSNLGNVRNKEKLNLLSPGLSKGKYLTVGLYKNGIRKTNTVHRIVFTSFNKEKSLNGLVIDHINNIKTDNRLLNLQSITVRENNSKDKSINTAPLGVFYISKRNAYLSTIDIKGNKIYLGSGKDKNHLSKLYNLALENIYLYNGNNKEFRNYINSLVC